MNYIIFSTFYMMLKNKLLFLEIEHQKSLQNSNQDLNQDLNGELL